MTQDDEALTYVVIGCFRWVYNECGPGLLESAYVGSLLYACCKRGLCVEREVSVPYYFDGTVVANYRMDLVVERRLILEIKACETLKPEHLKQALHYLRATDFELALLFNFGLSADQAFHSPQRSEETAARLSPYRPDLRVPDMRIALIALLFTTELLAQDSSGVRRAPESMCWRAQDGSRCAKYAIVELAVERPLLTTSNPLPDGSSASGAIPDARTRVLLALGFAANRANRASLGVATLLDLRKGVAGVDMRYRRWRGVEQGAWELSGGYARRRYSRAPCSFGLCASGIAHGARIGVSLTDGPATVFSRGELLRGSDRWLKTWSVGISANSTAAVAVGAVAGLYMALLSSLAGGT